jgi:protoporphyrinogen oxidase
VETDVLIVGAGLAGLSAAYHLRRMGAGARVLVVEKESGPGGRAATLAKGGYLFDHTGHLLHLHDPACKRLILDLLEGNLALHERSSWIHSHGVFTRYPFQSNTFGLPPRVVAECVAGFVRNKYFPRPMPGDPSFEQWCLGTFGEGISRRFLFPYNRKLWRIPLSRLTTDWQGRFLPRPSAAEVLYGALRDQTRKTGYNARFRYPVRGGIQALADALASRCGELRLNARLESVDFRARKAWISGLGEVRYERLVSTMPLALLLDLAAGLPEGVRGARRKLRWVDVHNLNIGVRRPDLAPWHWAYFPEKRFAFYRAGVLTNFSRHLAPDGCSSLYIEISRRPGARADLGELERRCVEGLGACGVLREDDRIDERLWIPIECAYVIYDRERRPALKAIFSHLGRMGVESIGRWGAWKYSFMEETLLDGKACARRLMGRGGGVRAPSGSELRPI